MTGVFATAHLSPKSLHQHSKTQTPFVAGSMGMLFYPGGGTTILPVPDGMRNRNQFGNHQSCFHRCQLPKIVDFKTTSKPRQRAKPSSQLGTRWHQCLGAWCGVMQCLRSTQGRIRVIATLLRLGMS